MIRIEAITLEEAYQNAASSLECSVTELKVEIIQSPSSGFLGLFKKSAIIVATKEIKVDTLKEKEKEKIKSSSAQKPESKVKKQENNQKIQPKKQKSKQVKKQKSQNILNDTIMPDSFVSTQDDEQEYDDVSNYLADYDENELDSKDISEIAQIVKTEINNLFDLICFNIDSIDVNVYDENTLLIEFKGDDAALLIGKEGYRYKALSYMIFNWINTKYQVQLRLEIAEFLKNQEESINKYLIGVCESIDRDGRAQTKILDGVLVQIALKELRDKYPDKYVVIRSTRDGLKYIIINDYHTN